MLNQGNRAQLIICGQHNGPFQASYTIWRNGEQQPEKNVPLEVNFAVFASEITQKTSFLTEHETIIWTSLNDPLGPPANAACKKSFHDCLVATIKAGQILYHTLASFGFEEMLDDLESMPDGSFLTIVTDCAFFPWEILCPRKSAYGIRYKPKEENTYKLLWGYRFHISYNLYSSRKVWMPPFEKHQKSPPFISLNLNPTIDNDLKEYCPLKPLLYHISFFEEKITNRCGQLLKEGDQIKATLISGDNHSSIIYIYCHGKNDAPFRAGGLECLEVDEGMEIKPDDLLERDIEFDHAPLIILNSCKSAMPSPLSFGHFLNNFLDQGAIGILGTTINIPATFAAAFGKRILEEYFLDRAPIGKALYQLRRDLLEMGNPLGLFYSLQQCPIDLTAYDFEEERVANH